MAYPNWMQQAQGGLLGTPDDYGGLLADQELQKSRQAGMQSFAASLLQASAPSRTPTSFGQALGGAMMQGGQTQQDALRNAFQTKVMLSQLAKKQQTVVPKDSAVIDDKGNTLFTNSSGPDFGKVEPKDYTPESIAAFAAGGGKDFSILRKAPPADKYQHTVNGLIFNDGKFYKPGGATPIEQQTPMTANEVRDWQISMTGDKASATAGARNKAQADAISNGDMSTAVSAFRQGIGNAPSMSRNPAAYAAFWNEYKAQASAEGNTVQQQLANQRISQSLKPAMEQTSKQIAANEGFLGTLESNINDADALQKKVAGNDPQFMNKVFNAWKRGGSTDPELAGPIAALDRWNNSIQGESAKIASGGVGSVGVSSDASIAEQMKLMNSAQTYSAWRASADAAIKEGHNRMDNLYSTRDSLAHQSASSPKNNDTPGPPNATTGPVKVSNRAEALKLAPGTHFVNPDGRELVR